jgi:hypothetical protein
MSVFMCYGTCIERDQWTVFWSQFSWVSNSGHLAWLSHPASSWLFSLQGSFFFPNWEQWGLFPTHRPLERDWETPKQVLRAAIVVVAPVTLQSCSQSCLALLLARDGRSRVNADFTLQPAGGYL